MASQRGRQTSLVTRWMEYSGIDLCTGDPQEIFEVIEMVGRGAYGAVWKAQDRRSKETVALKLIPCCGGLDEGLDAVRREITILKDCHHPNIVRYQGSYLADSNLWILMEYCGGRSVSDIMADMDMPLEEAQIAVICRESLEALAYLHEKLKIHRDVKCSNILLTEQGGVKLADFGVSAQLVNALSCRNSFVGTSYWMAPEVIQEKYYNGLADVWSLGISCIEMAEVTPPLVDQHPFQWIMTLQKHGPPTFSKPGKWSEDFHDFTAACLTPECVCRPTASMMLHHPFIAQAGPTSLLVPLVRACLEIRQKRDAERQLRAAQQRPGDSDTDSSDSGDLGSPVRQARQPSKDTPTGADSVECNGPVERNLFRLPADFHFPTDHVAVATPEEDSWELTVETMQAMLEQSEATVLPLLPLDSLPCPVIPDPLDVQPLDTQALAQMLLTREPMSGDGHHDDLSNSEEDVATQLRMTPSLFNAIKCFNHTLKLNTDLSRGILSDRQWATTRAISSDLSFTLGTIFSL